jgi:hypothetical protein
MAKSTSVCNSILALIFNGTAWADIAENDTTVPLTNLYLSLHTDDPGVGGAQTTNEANYTGYARLAVARTTAGWAVPSSGSTSNAALAQFIICSGGTNTITHVAIGKAETGAGVVLYSGALSSPRAVSNGIQPQFAIGGLVVSES